MSRNKLIEILIVIGIVACLGLWAKHTIDWSDVRPPWSRAETAESGSQPQRAVLTDAPANDAWFSAVSSMGADASLLVLADQLPNPEADRAVSLRIGDETAHDANCMAYRDMRSTYFALTNHRRALESGGSVGRNQDAYTDLLAAYARLTLALPDEVGASWPGCRGFDGLPDFLPRPG